MKFQITFPLLLLFTAACAMPDQNRPIQDRPQVEPPTAAFVGTKWALESFESSDDAIGRVVPPRVENYELTFISDSKVAVRLDCNRGTGSYFVSSPSVGGGSISFTPMAMTRAACGPDSMDSKIAADLGRVASYTMADGKLYLSLKADGGNYVWTPIRE